MFDAELEFDEELSEATKKHYNFEKKKGEDDEDDEATESVPATKEGDAVLEACLESSGLLSEYNTSVVRIDKKTKIHRVTQQAAFIIAREADDQLYKKLAVLNKKRAILKAAIAKKYQSQARKRARELMSGRGITTGKDMPDHDPNAKAH